MIDLTETGGWQIKHLTADEAAALRSAEFVQIAAVSPGRWRVRDKGLVGAARIGPANASVDVRIAPKVSIDRLLFMLGYVQKQRGWRDEEVDVAEYPDLLPAVAHAFARAGERALREGVLLGYTEVEEALTVVRGRIREADQVRRRYGLPVPVEVRYDDYTVDIPENQLLLAATERLRRLPGVPAQTRRLLSYLSTRLGGVRASPPGRPLPHWSPNRLNIRYHTALGIAELVLRGGSYELDDGTAVRVDGLLLEMWRVFQDFVTGALSDALRRRGATARSQDMSHHLDDARHIQLQPDLVSYDVADSPLGVADVKYKVAQTRSTDFYQILAYCTAMGLSRGYLIYAAGPAQPAVHLVRRAGVEIICYAIDLDKPPRHLLAQIDDLADHMIRGTLITR